MESRNMESPCAEALTQSSPALSIPGSGDHLYCGLEIYRSWCCSSFCKDYPDLQLGGDLIGDKASESPVLDDTALEGPLLQSKDLAEMGTLQLEPDLLGARKDAGPPVREVLDSSIILGGEPPSNSMLDGYLESKQLEVYRQHLQDILTRYGSPNHCLLPSSLALPTMAPPTLAPPTTALPSVLQLSHQLPTEERATNSLSFSREAATSHFSSPVLRISDSDQ